ncbi:hypothetical protein Moror_10805 [Moniliophthora roreri MCA 2997]|uniref:Uncharacterized protein n=1 Tax=Moniliophthora roreri (strain MCA 2997) TaxID=1381753 RepID=V2X693_MONRO|nr:hypothetical protein Moror_10805 [Moniliophthora roreri MCA 2997]
MLLLLRPCHRIVSNASHLGYFFAIRHASARNGPGRPSHIIRTLSPERLLPSDLVDFSDFNVASVKLFKDDQESAIINYTQPHGCRHINFPPATKGFLYFHRPEPHTPFLTSSVRFRICESPGTFSTGNDLFLPNGKPWEKSMWWMIQTGWADLLVESGAISQKELELWRPFAAPYSTVIRTLLPEELLPSDLVDLSGLEQPYMKLFTDNQESAIINYTQPHGSRPIHFPPATKGFLYFHRPEPHTPLLACSVRFRICESPETFSAGNDLLCPDGSPWRKSMWWLARNGWADLLAEREIISKTQLDKCRPLISTCNLSKSRRLVHAFYQPFPVVVTQSTTFLIGFYVLGEGSMVPLTIRGLGSFRQYLKRKVGHGIKGRIVLNLQIEQGGVLRLSQTVSSPYGEFLKEGMIPPCLYVAKQCSAQVSHLFDSQKIDPIRYALDILQEHEKRSSSSAF